MRFALHSSVDTQNKTPQEGPPVRMQEVYRPLPSKYSLCFGGGAGGGVLPTLARGVPTLDDW